MIRQYFANNKINGNKNKYKNKTSKKNNGKTKKVKKNNRKTIIKHNKYNQRGGIMSKLFNVDDIFDHEKVFEKIERKRNMQDLRERPHMYDRDSSNKLYENEVIKLLENELDKFNIKMYLGRMTEYQYLDVFSRIIIYTNKNIALQITHIKKPPEYNSNVHTIVISAHIYNDPTKIFSNFVKAFDIRYDFGGGKNYLYNSNGIFNFPENDMKNLYDYINPNIYADYMTLLSEDEIMEIIDPNEQYNFHEKDEEEQIIQKYEELTEEYKKLQDNMKNTFEKHKKLQDENGELKLLLENTIKDVLKYYPKTPTPKPTPIIKNLFNNK